MIFQKLKAQTLVTVSSLLKKELVISIISVWIAFMLVVLAFGTVSIGERLLVLKDFGMFLTNIICVFLITVGGSSILANEMKQKSIYTVLSKPISRSSYLFGKFLGLFFSTLIFNVFLHIFLMVFIAIFESVWHPELLINICFVSMECFILSAVCLLLSTIMVTPALVGIITAAIFIAGRNLATIIELLSKDQEITSASSWILGYIIRLAELIVPNLYLFTVADSLTYRIAPDTSYYGYAAIYALSFSVVTLIFASLIFRRRDFN